MNRQQEECYEHLRRWKVGALFMEAGTGKTLTACNLISSVDGVDLVLWIAPLRTIGNLMGEIEKWGVSLPIKAVGIESIGQSDRIYLDTLELVKSAYNPFVVCDESLKIKNYEAKRTKRAIEIGRLAEYKLALNGTPLSRNLLDLWSQMEFLSPRILNMSISTFKNTFCKYTTATKYVGGRIIGKKEWITGYENVDYLYSLIGNYVYECNLELNVSQNHHPVFYTVGSDAKREYGEIKKKYLSDEELEWRNNNIFLAMTSAMQHSYCVDEGKLNAVDRLMEKLPKDKTIIFCRFVKSREECERRYEGVRVLSFQKESFGLNLQEYSHTIFFDKVWDYALHQQACRRTYRTGQISDCQYYDLTGDVKLESLFDRCIDKKVSLTEYFKNKSKEQIYEDI